MRGDRSIRAESKQQQIEVNFVQPVNAATFTGDKAVAIVAIPQ